ncbi:Bug family tripartite tricarboxylate transporter substrate binding protein [Cupriavidus necator]
MTRPIDRRTAGKWLLAGAATAATTSLPRALLAQSTFPSKTLQLVVPYPAGGTTDVVARTLAHGLSGPTRSASIAIVENRPGGSSSIGTGFVARAQADGHTLLVTTGSTVTLLPHTQGLPFDPLKVLTPVAELGRTPLFLYANPGTPAKDLKGLVAWMKTNPGKITYGSYGQGTQGHFGGVILGKAAGVDMLHVPFQGGAPAMQALIGGHVQLMIDAYQPAMEQVKAGKVLALAVSSPERSPYAPEVPTFRELGLPQLEAISGFFGMFAPAATKPETVAVLSRLVSGITASDAYRQSLAKLGVLPPQALTPAQMDRANRQTNGQWAKFVRDIGYRRGDA